MFQYVSATPVLGTIGDGSRVGYSILVVVRYQGWLRTSNLNNDPDALRLLRLFMGVMKAVKSGNFSRVDVLNTRLVARERIGACRRARVFPLCS